MAQPITTALTVFFLYLRVLRKQIYETGKLREQFNEQ
jgi:hypothetical protein